jgi:hypothetical protein
VPQSLKTTRWNRVLRTRFGKPNKNSHSALHLLSSVLCYNKKDNRTWHC